MRGSVEGARNSALLWSMRHENTILRDHLGVLVRSPWVLANPRVSFKSTATAMHQLHCWVWGGMMSLSPCGEVQKRLHSQALSSCSLTTGYNMPIPKEELESSGLCLAMGLLPLEGSLKGKETVLASHTNILVTSRMMTLLGTLFLFLKSER